MVQLRFKPESELHLLLVVLDVLTELLLNDLPCLHLLLLLALQLRLPLLHVIQTVPEHPLVVLVLVDLLRILLLHLPDLLRVLLVHLLNHQLVVGFAAEFKQHRVHFPDRSDQDVLLFATAERLLEHLVEAERVDE